MTLPLPIPNSHLTLMACLRSAFHGAPADQALRQTDWAALLKQAREHGIDTFLFPWLVDQIPDLFSAQAAVPADSAPAVWRSLFLNALTQSVLRRYQLAELFADFARAKLDMVPLKGAWLCETVYDDPAQRTMSDLDLLIRKEDRDASHAQFLARGYYVKQNTLQNPFSRDQSYYHSSHPKTVELHWDFSSQMINVVPPPDLAAIWKCTTPSTCCGQPVRLLALEDFVAHLAHHLLGHLFALPLRAYLDLALLLKRFGDRLSAEQLDAASARWKTGAGVPFLLRFTSDLFAFPLSPTLETYTGQAEQTRLRQACHALFNLPPAQARAGETTLLQYRDASVPDRLRLVLRRIFMPRDFLMLFYPCARHACGMPFAWLLRARDLYRRKSDTLKSMFKDGSADAQLLADAQTRGELVRWLLAKKDGPA